MQEIVFEWLDANQRRAWLIVPTLAFLEACPGVGLFVSGIFLLSICTLLYSQDIVPLTVMLPLAFAGACISDHLGFYVGRWLGPKFHATKFAKNRREAIKKAETLLVRYGAFSILFGRLVPAVRSKVPLLIGASHFNRLSFTLIDILACLVWTSGLGILVMGLQNLLTG